MGQGPGRTRPKLRAAPADNLVCECMYEMLPVTSAASLEAWVPL